MGLEPKPRPLRLGKPGLVVDERYRLERPLGLGGFGEVWQATQVVEEAAIRPVALKLVRAPAGLASDTDPADHTPVGSSGSGRWLDEVRAVRDVRCESIVTIFDVGISREPPLAFIAMELLDGESLQARISHAPIPWRRALAITREIVAALDVCHQVGVIHRDLKPQNIFITEAGRVCVLDFGVAALAGSDVEDVPFVPAEADLDDPAAGTGAVSLDELPGAAPPTVESHMVGTPGYIAPEAIGGGRAGPAADVYAVGVLLHQMISGQLPHRVPAGLARPTRDTGRQEIDRYRAALVAATVRGNYTALGDVAPATPRAVVDLVERSLSPEPDDRRADLLSAAIEEAWNRPFGQPDPPYAGLDAFGADRTGCIAGRDADIDYAANSLRDQRAIVLSGPSGCGKSSLAIAGVAPRLDEMLLLDVDAWKSAVLRPAESHGQLVAGESDQEPAPGVGVVVVIDQLEEVLRLPETERAAFCTALATLADGSGPVALAGEQLPATAVRLIATVRDDLFGRVAALPELRRFPERNLYTVRGVEPNDISEIVTGPARAAGYQVEGAAEVIAEAGQILQEDASALPLVQFAMTRWWEQRDPDERRLTRAEWKQIGGIKGALAAVAQSLYDRLDDGDRERMRALLIGLFRADGTRVRAEERRIAPDRASRDVLAELLRRRLVRRHVDADKRATLEVAHEALAERWPPLHQWLEETRAERELVQDLTYDAHRWQKAGAPAEMLWHGRRLETAIELYDRLDAPLCEFVDPAIRLRRRHKLQRRAIALAVIAVVAGLLALRYVDIARERKAAEDARDQAREVAERNQALRVEAEKLALAAREQRDEADARANQLSLEKARTYLEVDPTATVAWLNRLTEMIPEAATLAAEAEDRGVALRVLRGHESHFASSGVNDAAFSPDGKLIASAGDDGTIRLWRPDTGDHETLRLHKRAVRRVAFSPDSRLVAGGGRDGVVSVWRVDTRELVLTGKQARPVNDIAFSPDSCCVAAVGEDRKVRLWEVATGAEKSFVAHSRTVNRVEFARNGIFVTAGGDGDVRVWDESTGESRVVGRGRAVRDLAVAGGQPYLVTGTGDGQVTIWPTGDDSSPQRFRHPGKVNAVSVSSDGALIAAAGDRGAVRVWRAGSGELLLSGRHQSEVVAIAFSPDNQRLATGGGHHKSGGDTSVRIWELATGESRVLAGHTDRIRSLGFSPDGQMLVSASADKSLRVWPVLPLENRVLRGHKASVWRLAFAPDGTRLVSAGLDKQALIWNLSDFTSTPLPGHRSQVRRVAYSADGRYIATATRAGRIAVFDQSGQLIERVRGHRDSVIHIEFSPDSQLLASAGADDKIRVWRFASGEADTFKGHSGGVNHIAFAPDGKSLASGGQDSRVLVWNLATRQPVELTGHTDSITHLEYSPDGKHLASTGADKQVLLWNLASGTSVSMVDEKNPIRDRIDYVTFSPDGAQLAAAAYDGTIRVFDLATREQSQILRGHTEPVYKVVFAPRAGVAASSSADNTVRLWDLATGESRVLRGHRDQTMHLAFSPDGTRLASSGLDNTIRLWPVILPRHGADLRSWLAAATSERTGDPTK